MKKSIFKIALFSLIAIAAASCVAETSPYQPAEPATGEQIYFPKTISEKIVLTKDQTSFDIPVLRNTPALEAIDVAIEASGNGLDVFEVPGTFSFQSGEKESKITVEFDPADLTPNTFYDLTIKISDAGLTTPYGTSTLAFTAGINLPWIAFDEGIMYETPYWGEEEKKTLYYQQISENIRFCRVPECFGYETIKGGDPYDVQDYTFYWNTETNQIYIPKQWMGYANSNGETWFMDESEFYNWYWEGYGYAPGTDEWFAFCDSFRAKYPDDYYPYYDGNGGFYLADYYTAGQPGTSAYLGYYTGGGVGDSFICNNFVRADYTIEAQYTGMFVTPEGSASPIIGFNYTEDVSGIKFVVTDQDTDPVETLMSIIEDTAENVNDINNLEGDYVEVEVSDVEPGLCRVVAVPYNASEELQADYAVLCDFYFPGTGSGGDTDVKAQALLVKPSIAFPAEVMKQYGMTDYNSMAFAIIGENIKSGAYFFNSSAAIDAYRAQGVTDEDFIASGTSFSEKSIDSINSEDGYLNAFIGSLNPDTEWELIIGLDNVYGKSKIFDLKESTDPAPVSVPAVNSAKKTIAEGFDSYYAEFEVAAKTGFNLREGWGKDSRKIVGTKNATLKNLEEKR